MNAHKARRMRCRAHSSGGEGGMHTALCKMISLRVCNSHLPLPSASAPLSLPLADGRSDHTPSHTHHATHPPKFDD